MFDELTEIKHFYKNEKLEEPQSKSTAIFRTQASIYIEAF